MIFSIPIGSQPWLCRRKKSHLSQNISDSETTRYTVVNRGFRLNTADTKEEGDASTEGPVEGTKADPEPSAATDAEPTSTSEPSAEKDDIESPKE